MFPAPAGMNRLVEYIHQKLGSVFPAPAGMNRLPYRAAFLEQRVPRASGDEPICENDRMVHVPCSPRQRG